jgi:2-phosphoglycerate kinase
MIYLIGGIARSGKTLVRKEILKRYNISGIGTDSIRYMLSHSQPELGIDHNKPSTHNGPLMWPYIDNLIHHIVEYDNEDFVIEGDVLLPEYLGKYVEDESVKTCFIGFSNTKVESKFREMVDNSTEGDWTKEYTEKEMKDFVKSGIKRSKKYGKECKELGVEYFDTGKDFDKSVHDIVSSLISANLSI